MNKPIIISGAFAILLASSILFSRNGSFTSDENIEIKNPFYYVVKVEKISENINKLEELYKNKKNNYFCESKNKENFNCEIYPLNMTKLSKNKSIQMDQFLSKSSIQKDQLNNQNHYLLSSNKEINKNTSYSLKNKKDEYLQFTLDFQIIVEKFILSTDIVLGQVKKFTNENISSSSKFKCKEESGDFFDCEIYKSNSENNFIDSENKEIVFNHLSDRLNKISSNSDFNLKNKNIFIKSKNHKFFRSSLKNKIINVFLSNNDDDSRNYKKLFDLDVLSGMLGKIEENSSSLFFLQQKKDYSFLLATKSTSTINEAKKNEEDFFDYKCIFNYSNNKTIEDDSCMVFIAMSNNEKKTYKHKKFFSNLFHANDSDEINANSHFLIRYEKIKLSFAKEPTSISIFEKKEKSSIWTKISDLNFQEQINSSPDKNEIQMAAYKIDSVFDDQNWNFANLKCSFLSDLSSPFSCKIFKFSQSNEDLHFTNWNINNMSQITGTEKLKNKSFYAIELDKKYYVEDIKKDIFIFENSSSNTKKYKASYTSGMIKNKDNNEGKFAIFL